MGVSTVFQYGDLNETLYVRQPEGFKEKGNKDYFYVDFSIIIIKFTKPTFNTRSSKFNYD
jgi:hypothetical protein